MRRLRLDFTKLQTWSAIAMAAAAMYVAAAGARIGSAHKRTASAQSPMAALDVGEHIQIPSVDFRNADLTILIATSPACAASKHSLSIYRKFQEYAAATGVPLYFVQAEQDTAWLGLLPATNVRTVHVKPKSVGIENVPTFAVVDRFGIIRAIRLGAVEQGAEDATIADLIGEAPTAASALRSVTEHELAAWRKASVDVQLIDVREIGNRPEVAPLAGAFAMPATELSLRSRYELDKRRPLVLDCRPVDPGSCQTLMVLLRQDGFTRIAGVDYVSERESSFLGRVTMTIAGARR
jgi:hypothetical protein